MPTIAISTSHFGWISRPVTMPATGISNRVAIAADAQGQARGGGVIAQQRLGELRQQAGWC